MNQKYSLTTLSDLDPLVLTADIEPPPLKGSALIVREQKTKNGHHKGSFAVYCALLKDYCALLKEHEKALYEPTRPINHA